MADYTREAFGVRDREGRYVEFKDAEVRAKLDELIATANTSLSTANAAANTAEEAASEATNASEYMQTEVTAMREIVTQAASDAAAAVTSSAAAQAAAEQARDENAQTVGEAAQTAIAGAQAAANAAVASAEASAQAAAGSAQAAATSEGNASASASAADASAQSAATSAQDAEDSVETIRTIKTETETARDQAANSAADAADSASAAAGSAQSAQESATSASNSATSALQSASAAQVSASNASTSAQSAGTSETNAAASDASATAALTEIRQIQQSIPADYTALSNVVTELQNDVADAAKLRGQTGGFDILFTDSDGNIGARLEKGFDSARLLESDKTSVYDLCITDEQKNIIFAIKNGEIIKKDFVGKYVSILGDSISSYNLANCKMASADGFYPRYNITSLNEIWYKILCDTTGMKLLKSASWEGSKVTGDTQSETGYAGCSDARISSLADGTTTPDCVFVEIGTNDFGNGTELGSFTSVSDLPANEGSINTFSEAYALMLSKIHTVYPKAKVYCMTIMARHTYNTVESAEYPAIINGHSIDDFNNVIRKVASCLNCDVIESGNCGINYWNLDLGRDGTQDDRLIGDNFVHPNRQGMALLARKVINSL